jgi:hypothetical protein
MLNLGSWTYENPGIVFFPQRPGEEKVITKVI